jgi:hypothetical protein
MAGGYAQRHWTIGDQNMRRAVAMREKGAARADPGHIGAAIHLRGLYRVAH